MQPYILGSLFSALKNYITFFNAALHTRYLPCRSACMEANINRLIKKEEGEMERKQISPGQMRSF